MRLYGKKNIRRLIDKRTKKRQEMRDAILWEIDGEKCRVKIQGSNTMVVAHFPRNQKKVPLWLRVGNAVKIVHKEGIRGYIEVIGEGRCIPTAVSGESLPDSGDLSDGIISGLVVTIRDPTAFTITSGTYRYNGIIYTSAGTSLYPYVMDDPAPMTMGEVPIVLLNGNSDPLYVGETPPNGYARYDVIYLNLATGGYGIVEGSHVLITQLGCDGPGMPDVPVGTVQLAFILMVGNGRSVSNTDLYKEWEDPYFCYFVWGWGQGYVGEVVNPWKPGDPPSVYYDAIVITKYYSQYYTPLYGICEMSLAIAYGDFHAFEGIRSTSFDGWGGTPAYHPFSGGMVGTKIRVEIKEDQDMKILIQDIRYETWVPPIVPLYSIIAKISVRRVACVLEGDPITGIIIKEGTTVGNYTELMYWRGRDIYTNEELPFGGDIEELADMWG